MAIRSKRSTSDSVPASEETQEKSTAAPEKEPAAKAEVKAAAELQASSAPDEVVYELITPYPIVTPGGVRFLPNEPQSHPRTNWLQSNVDAGLFRVIRKLG